MSTPPKKAKPAARVVSAKIKRKRPPVEVVVEADEIDEEEELDEEADEADDVDDDGEELEEEEEEASDSSTYKRKEVKGEAKSFFDTLGDTLRSAGETATRYTKVGVSYAEIEKLRFSLKSAYAALGEVTMRCWDDAPDLGLTSKDPAVAQALKRVKDVRRKIREQEAKIASLKSE